MGEALITSFFVAIGTHASSRFGKMLPPLPPQLALALTVPCSGVQDSMTALMFAAAKGHADTVKVLVGAKADPSVKDNVSHPHGVQRVRRIESTDHFCRLLAWSAEATRGDQAGTPKSS